MIFHVGNKIYVEDASESLLRWCKENLEVTNPEYYKKRAMGKYTGNIPERFCLYEIDGKNAILPFGVVAKLKGKFPERRFLSRICPSERIEYKSGISLYPYQKNAVEAALVAKNGILVMPCGAGKTQTALEIISRLGVKTLWLTHTQDLLNQSMNRAKAVLEAPSDSYGTITGGKVNIGCGITFATVQTMSKIDLAEYKDTWGCVVVDECQKAVGGPTKVMQFYKVLSALSCRYKIGLTATPKRADGMQAAMFALLGDIIYEVDKKDVAETTCPVHVDFIETDYTPDFDVVLAGDGTIDYSSLVTDMTQNETRFNLVWHTIKLYSELGPTLVLANRVEYLKRLDEVYSGKSICLSAMGTSKAAKKTRKEALQKLNNRELDCIFATYQLAKEGLDVPNLRNVIFASPEKDETTVTQAAGRVGRKAEGKEYGTVVDFVDNFGMYKGWAKKRTNIYKKLDYIC